MRPYLRFRSYAPLMAMILLFTGIMAFSLYRTVLEADRVDIERTQLAVAAAVQGEIDQVVSMVDDNAIWDDAVTALYGPEADEQFLLTSWGVSTADGNYDTAIIIDSRGRTQYAYRGGHKVDMEALATYGEPLEALLARLAREKQTVGGLIRTADGLVSLAVSPILPTTEALSSMVPASGASRLIFARKFDAQAASKIGQALVLNGAELNGRAVGNASIALEDAAGQNVGLLSWQPAGPGLEALHRAWPLIFLGAFLHFVIALLVGRRMMDALRRVSEQALVDSLSGLPNRRALREAMTLRLDGGETLALALIDLDGFKEVNDNYGHPVGDRLLKLVSEMLAELSYRDTLVARLGGDEFAIMIRGKFCSDQLEKIAQKILSKLSKPFHIDERTVIIGASIGLASGGSGDMDAGELMRRADIAMYAAKEAGKMRFAWFDEALDQKQAHAQAIETELRAAIETEDFELAYQPVFGIDDRRIKAVEALLRWRSESRGEISPAEFIPVAEETGLIDRIGIIVLRKACLDGLHWGDVKIAVNVSAAQLRNPEFPAEVSRVLAETGFPADRLEIEITEGYLVHDPEFARRVLQELRALGIGISLDDFGTGYASAGFLRQFPLTKFKLDRSLVSEAADSHPVRALVQASIAMANALNMDVAAEGVETEAQADLMRVAGCSQLQGWLLSQAVTADQISEQIGLENGTHAQIKLAG